MCDLNNITEKGKPVEKQGRKAKDLKYRCIMVAGCQLFQTVACWSQFIQPREQIVKVSPSTQSSMPPTLVA